VKKSGSFSITNETFGAFIQCLRNLKNLELDFAGCPSMTSEGFRQIMKGLTHLDTLERLTLNFEACPSLQVDGFLCSLYENLHRLKSLSYLKINLSYMPWTLTNKRKGMMVASQQNTLKNVFLNIIFCGRFTDDSLEIFGKLLQGSPCLEQLNIKIRNNDYITHEGLISLADGLMNLEKLHQADLNFSWCPKITKKGFEYLCQKLKACGDGEDVLLDLDIVHGGFLSKPGPRNLEAALESEEDNVD